MSSSASLPAELQRSIIFRGAEVMKVPASAFVAPDARQLQVLTRDKLASVKAEILGVADPSDVYFLCYWKAKSGLFGRSGPRKALPLSNIREVRRGASSTVFRKAKGSGVAITDDNQCFSVHSSERTLDWICWNDDDCAEWVSGLNSLIALVASRTAAAIAPPPARAAASAPTIASAPPLPPSAPPAVDHSSAAAAAAYDEGESLPDERGSMYAAPQALRRTSSGTASSMAGSAPGAGASATFRSGATAAAAAAAALGPISCRVDARVGSSASVASAQMTTAMGRDTTRTSGAAPPALPGNRQVTGSASTSATVLPAGRSSSSSSGGGGGGGFAEPLAAQQAFSASQQQLPVPLRTGVAWDAAARQRYFERTVFDAIASRKEEEVVFALEDGCDLELRHPDTRRTLLQHASAVGAHRIVRALLQRGAEFDPNRDPASDALALAVSCGHFLAASEIIAVADNTPRLTVQLCNMRRGAAQDTLLHMACRAHSPAVARLLLEKSLNPLFACNAAGRSPLLDACAPCVLALKERQDINKPSPRKGNAAATAAAARARGPAGASVSPVSGAAMAREAAAEAARAAAVLEQVHRAQLDTARELLERGAGDAVELADAAGDTALHFAAAASCNPLLVQLLLESGADACAVNDAGLTPADALIRAGSSRVSAGDAADVIEKLSEYGGPPTDVAAAAALAAAAAAATNARGSGAGGRPGTSASIADGRGGGGGGGNVYGVPQPAASPDAGDFHTPAADRTDSRFPRGSIGDRHDDGTDEEYDPALAGAMTRQSPPMHSDADGYDYDDAGIVAGAANGGLVPPMQGGGRAAWMTVQKAKEQQQQQQQHAAAHAQPAHGASSLAVGMAGVDGRGGLPSADASIDSGLGSGDAQLSPMRLARQQQLRRRPSGTDALVQTAKDLGLDSASGGTSTAAAAGAVGIADVDAASAAAFAQLSEAEQAEQQAAWLQYIYDVAHAGYVRPWVLSYDETHGAYFFFHEETGESAWEPPPDVVAAVTAIAYSGDGSGGAGAGDAGSLVAADGSVAGDAADSSLSSPRGVSPVQNGAAGTASAPARMATGVSAAAAAAAGRASAGSAMPTHSAVDTVDIVTEATAGSASSGSDARPAAASSSSSSSSGVVMPTGAIATARTITSPPMPPPPNVARIAIGGRLAFGSPAKLNLMSPQRAAARVALVSPQRVLQGSATTGPSASAAAAAGAGAASAPSSGGGVPALPLTRLAGDVGLGLQTLASHSPRSLPASARQADAGSAAGDAALPAPAETSAAVPTKAAAAAAAAAAAPVAPSGAASVPIPDSSAAAAAAAQAASAAAAVADAARLRDRFIAQLRSGVPAADVWRRMALELVSPDVVRELQAAVAAHAAAGRPVATLLMDTSADAAVLAMEKSGAVQKAEAASAPAPAPVTAAHDEKYVKMLRTGVPPPAVWGRMHVEGVPAPAIKALESALAQHLAAGATVETLFKDGASAAASAAGGAGGENAASAPQVPDHDEKYVKMLRMGVPGGAVWGRMAADGVPEAAVKALESAVKSYMASGGPMADFLRGKDGGAGAAAAASSSASSSAAADAAPTNGDGSAASAAPSVDSRKAALETVSSEPRFNKYGAMKKMGVPLGAIKGQMGADGLSKDDIALFLRAHATLAALESMQLLTPDKKAAAAADASAGADASKAASSGAAAGGAGAAAAGPAAPAGPTTLKLHWDPLELDETALQNTVWGRLRQKAAAAATGRGALSSTGALPAPGDAAAGEEASLITTLFAAKAAAAPAKGAGKDGASGGSAAGGAGKDGDGASGSASASAASSPALITTLDPRRANNLNILLAQFKRFPDHAAVCSAVYALTSGPLNRDALEKLSQLIPKPDELRAVRGYKGEPERLMECDRFFLAISRVPRFPTKVASFITLLSAGDIAADVLRRASLVRDACSQVVASETLQVVLAQVLAVGNLLNAGHSRLTARAITIDSLLKLSSTKAADRKTSLMDALVMTLMSKSASAGAAAAASTGASAGAAAGGAGAPGGAPADEGSAVSPALSPSTAASLDLGAELSLLSEARRLEVTEIASDFKQLSTALAAALREAEAEAADLQKEADAAAKAAAAAAVAPPPLPGGAGGSGAAAAGGGGGGGGGPMARNAMLAEMMAKRAAAAGAAPAPTAAAAPPAAPVPGGSASAAAPAIAAPAPKSTASANPCSRADRQHFVDELRAFARSQQAPVAALQAAVAAADAGLKEVAAYFGEDTAKATCGGLLGTLQQFVIDFGAAQRRVRATQAQQAKAAALGASQTLGSSMRSL